MLDCPCCGARLAISRANLTRLYNAINAMYPDGGRLSLDIGLLPAGVDWTGAVTDEELAAAAAAAASSS